MTYFCVTYVACGGILVGLVIRYLNALLKDITLGFSIVLAAVGSMVLFNDVEANPMFMGGTALVIFSVVLYGNVLKERINRWFGSGASGRPDETKKKL